VAFDDAFGPVRHFHVSTRDEAEAEEFIRQMYVGNRSRFLGAPAGARFNATVVAGGELAVGRVDSTVDYRAATDPFDDCLFLRVDRGCLRMREGGTETILLAGDVCLCPLGGTTDFEQFQVSVRTLQVSRAQVAAAAEQAAGIAAAGLRFESPRPVSAAAARRWSAFLELATGPLLTEESRLAHPLLAAELARTAAVTALHTFPNTALTASYEPGPGWTGAGPVRRAAAFIQAHAAEPVTMEQVATAAGVSTRGLEYAFRRRFDTTPAGYLRRVRLERAHGELRDADLGADVTVATVARRWGWASPSQFTKAYKQHYGKPPGRTLRAEGKA
jgi:AraC-like DNA-binding protein